MDNQRGTTLASVYDPFVGEQTSPTGQFLQVVLVVLFHASGGLHLFLDVLYESYRIWPAGTLLPRPDARFPLFLLGQADRQLRKLYEHGEVRYAESPPLDLLNNLLYYFARATSSALVTSNQPLLWSTSASVEPSTSSIAM